ncbi:hypothetical protein P3W24_04045 [Luteibacter sp. PPL201]|uniref:Uncharacterized protein n=1 Tax=Luteibacter sahnii TaxID=3021977 RepID=A0ABT6B7T1_9GAMM
MAVGVRIKDRNGNIVVDFTSKLPRIIGYIDTNGSAGSINVPELALGNAYWVVSPISGTSGRGSPNVSISGTTLSWSYPNATVNDRIYYGYY